jgi:putative intracellular protease/amidase
MKKVLFIVTSAKKMKDSETGIWFEELSTPYYVLTDKGVQVDIASPKGKGVHFAPGSLSPENLTGSVKKFREDKFAMNKIEHTKLLKLLDLNDYDAVFFPGGHGAVVDLPADKFIEEKLGEYFETGKPVAAICHGPGGLVQAKKSDGTSIVNGLRVTSFTNSEEKAIGLEDKVPFLLESRLRELGGKFECGSDFQEFAVADKNLITGQNPASSKKCAELLLQVLGN